MLTTDPEPQQLAPSSYGCSGLGRLLHSSRFVPSSWATRLSKIQKIQEGQREKQQPLNRVQGWMCPASQRARQGKQALRLTQQAANSPTRRRSGPPAGSCASSLPKWPALTSGKVGTQQGAQATSGDQLSGLFCLLNSSAVSEPKANPNLSPRTPSKSKPRAASPCRRYRPLPSSAYTHSAGVCRVSSGEQMATARPSSALAGGSHGGQRTALPSCLLLSTRSLSAPAARS